MINLLILICIIFYTLNINLKKVNQRYQNSLINDPDLNITTQVTNFLFLNVSTVLFDIYAKYFFFINIIFIIFSKFLFFY